MRERWLLCRKCPEVYKIVGGSSDVCPKGHAATYLGASWEAAKVSAAAVLNRSEVGPKVLGLTWQGAEHMSREKCDGCGRDVEPKGVTRRSGRLATTAPVKLPEPGAEVCVCEGHGSGGKLGSVLMGPMHGPRRPRPDVRPVFKKPEEPDPLVTRRAGYARKETGRLWWDLTMMGEGVRV